MGAFAQLTQSSELIGRPIPIINGLSGGLLSPNVPRCRCNHEFVKGGEVVIVHEGVLRPHDLFRGDIL